MLNKLKKNKVICILFALAISIFIGLIIRDYLPYPKNDFGIRGNELMCLSHFYNVNGVIGAGKKDFTHSEQREIMIFLSELKYKETVPIRKGSVEDTIYGIPVQLIVEKKNGTKFEFSFRDSIKVIVYDKNGDILSKKNYTTNKKRENSIYKILEIKRD